MLEDSRMQVEFTNEYAVLRLARDSKSKHICPIEGICIGAGHVALRLRAYHRDLRHYLLESRDAADLPHILSKVVSGVQELHDLGFVHRDLKPDNIVLSEDSKSVALIDFNRALPVQDQSEYEDLGTPGYQPDSRHWKDTDFNWDYWALGAIILESDMRPNDYYQVASEKDAKKVASKHLAHPQTSKCIKKIVKDTVLANADAFKADSADLLI